MDVLYKPDIVARLSRNPLIVDACCLIDASKNKKLEDIYGGIVSVGGKLMTVSPSWVEMLRGASTRDERDRLRKFLISLGVSCMVGVQEDFFSQDGALFQLILRNCKTKDPSYVDALLMFATYRYPNARLVTNNYKDIPREIFDLEEMIVFGKGCDDLHSTGVYKINEDRFKRRMEQIE